MLDYIIFLLTDRNFGKISQALVQIENKFSVSSRFAFTKAIAKNFLEKQENFNDIEKKLVSYVKSEEKYLLQLMGKEKKNDEVHSIC